MPLTADTKAPVQIYLRMSKRPGDDHVTNDWWYTRDSPSDHEYILESALPGTLEEIECVIDLADELHCLLSSGMGSEDQHGELVKDLRRALAALRQKEKSDDTKTE